MNGIAVTPVLVRTPVDIQALACDTAHITLMKIPRTIAVIPLFILLLALPGSADTVRRAGTAFSR